MDRVVIEDLIVNCPANLDVKYGVKPSLFRFIDSLTDFGKLVIKDFFLNEDSRN